MSPLGSSKRLDYEASAGLTTYGTWRAHFSLFQDVATRHEGSLNHNIVWESVLSHTNLPENRQVI
jgi:hypothetical protein